MLSASNFSNSDDDDHRGFGKNKISKISEVIKKLLLFLFYWQSFFSITDAALRVLLRFIKYFVCLLGIIFLCHPIKELSNHIPTITHSSEKMLENNETEIIEYVVCPKCQSYMHTMTV